MLKKMQRKALISALLFSFVLSVVSCSSSDENDDDDNNKSRKNTSDTSIISDDSESGDLSSQDTIESEWKNELADTPYDLTDDSTDLSGDTTISDNTESDYYAYYDELSKAYDATDKDISYIGMLDDDNILIPIFFSSEDECKCTLSIYKYSIMNNTLDVIFTTVLDRFDLWIGAVVDDLEWTYTEGNIYLSYGDGDQYVLEKYESNNKIASIDVDYSLTSWKILDKYILSGTNLISKDLSEIIEIPTEMEVTIEHGLTEYQELKIVNSYKDYLIGYLDDTYYILDTKASSLEWVEYDTNINWGTVHEVYGNFAFTSKGLYDIMTGECISADNTGVGYYGGDHNVQRVQNTDNNGYWYEIKYPNSNIKVYPSLDVNYYKLSIENEDSDNIIQLNNEYYIVMDDYGMFLRNYEIGEAEEQTIILNSDFDYEGFDYYGILS